jgi:hypothetical protein
MVVGVRSYYAHQAGNIIDNCPRFTEPIVQAWQIPYTLFDSTRQSAGDLIGILRPMQRSGEAGAILWAE